MAGPSEQRLHAEAEQAALRRVATLVAGDPNAAAADSDGGSERGGDA